MPSIYSSEKTIVLLVTVFVLVFSIDSFGQYNLRNKVNKPYYFGLSLGVHNANYLVTRSADFNDQAPTEYRTIESVNGSGMNVHLINNLKLNKYFDLRALPGVSFGTRALQYTHQNIEDKETQELQAVFFEFPLQLRYLSDPIKDMRIYVLSGMKYSYDVQTNSRDQDASNLRVAANDFALEFGIGFQIFSQYVIFSPEIKYTQGFSNTIINNSGPSSNLQKVLTRSFTLSLHFEG